MTGRRWLAIAAMLAGAAACTPTSPPRSRHQSALRASPHDDGPPLPTCAPLPEARPEPSTVAFSQSDPETLATTDDFVFVADAPCPVRPWLPAPECFRLSADAMDTLWQELREIALHRVRLEPHGECIHCGSRFISVAWPGGRCDVGWGHFEDVARESWPRFQEAVGFLKRVADLARRPDGEDTTPGEPSATDG